MKSLACGVLFAAFLLVSSPSSTASYAVPPARIVYVADLPLASRRRKRRNHYSGWHS